MKKGYLSDYFEGVAVKRLSDVEASPAKSNQHEFGTTRRMREFIGARYKQFDATYIWFGGEQEGVPEYGSATMYDARSKKAHRRPEWRIYYDSNGVTELMEPGDTLFVAKRRNADALISSLLCRADYMTPTQWHSNLGCGLSQNLYAWSRQDRARRHKTDFRGPQ